jgi:AraC-like DNA-binding protein
VEGLDGTLWQPMSVERLPDLNVSRGGHRTLVIGDEIVLLGGHTYGFKPLESAEYYADGAWHTVPMLYSHCNGFAAPLPDGTVLLGGGSAEAFGIGQSWGAEIYNPASHTFSAAGIMSIKRAMSSALARPDGSVVIVGNWYAGDSWETWTPDGGFVQGEALSPGWAEPLVFPASPDDILVFGPWDTRGNNPGSRVEHIGGRVEQEPLLEECYIYANYYVFPEDQQIAEYTYLTPVLRPDSTSVILKVASGQFSPLEMEHPLPVTGPDGHPVTWFLLQVDRPARLAWVQGFDAVTGSYCLARLNYDATFDGGKASATYYYAEQPGGFPSGCARLLPGGRFVLAGGIGWEEGSFPALTDNFNTFSSAYIFHTEQPRKAGVPLWVYGIGLLVLSGGAFLVVWRLRKRDKDEEAPEEDNRLALNLLEQLSALIQEKELWRRKDLRISDVATELATNKTYVSLLLNNISGSSFTDIVNGYRVRHAQSLMREHPEMLLDDVASESGFSSYTSFYRNFKSIAGMTPQEWKKQ